jgi:hypothetical protein
MGAPQSYCLLCHKLRERQDFKVTKEPAPRRFIFRRSRTRHHLHPGDDADKTSTIPAQFLCSRGEAIQEIQQNVAVDERVQLC